MNAHNEVVTALTEEERFRASERRDIAERAVRIIGSEIARETMVGLSWAADVHGQEIEDLLTRVLTGRLKGILQQVSQETKRLEEIAKKQHQVAIELRVQLDRIR